MSNPPTFDSSLVWQLVATLLFVMVNGFFVAAEFSLVKVRPGRIDDKAEGGSPSARSVREILSRLDLYLSSCQLGITVASLVLGWLAEPAVARLLLLLASKLGIEVSGSVVRALALGMALTIITIFHMTLGEQAPKILAIRFPERVALRAAFVVRLFTTILRPLIWLVNQLSNAMLKAARIDPHGEHEGSMTPNELKSILAASARAGQITPRQRQFTENILGFIDLEVRHVLVPRTELTVLIRSRSAEINLQLIRESKHSRFALCRHSLDDVDGIVHAKDVLSVLAAAEPLELEKIARPPLFVPDTQPLGRMIVELQRARSQCAIVVDEHGVALGMAFLEDALEEIVGPMYDEFDVENAMIREIEPDVFEVDGHLPLPEAVSRFGLEGAARDDEDTLGGYVVSLIGRLPQRGDEVTIGDHVVCITEIRRRRVARLRLTRRPAAKEPSE